MTQLKGHFFTKTGRDKNQSCVPGVLLLAGLTLAVYLADVVLEQIGATGQFSCAGDANFLIEAAIGLVCLALPALYVHFTGRTISFGKKFGATSRSGGEPSQKKARPVTTQPISSQSDNWRQGPRPKASQSQNLTASKQGTSAATLARWNQTINAAAKAGDPEKAESTLKDMESRGISPDIISFNSVIHASAKLGNLERAEKWLKCMRMRS